MRSVRLTGDTRQVFLQIRACNEHRNALPFHWVRDKTTIETMVLRLTRAVFELGKKIKAKQGIMWRYVSTPENSAVIESKGCQRQPW